MQLVAVVAIVAAFVLGFTSLMTEQRRAQLVPVRIKRNRH